MPLVPEQIQDLAWASLDDLLEANGDILLYGACWAKIVDDEGDMRLKRIPPPAGLHPHLQRTQEER